MMTETTAFDHTSSRQALLHAALDPFVCELRLADPAELLAFVARGQFANLDDVIQSSLELAYRPGAFAFGWSAEAFVTWSDPPAVLLDMEFTAAGITVFFVLRIAANRHDVVMRCIAFADPSRDPHSNTQALADALWHARTPDGQASDKPAAAR